MKSAPICSLLGSKQSTSVSQLEIGICLQKPPQVHMKYPRKKYIRTIFQGKNTCEIYLHNTKKPRVLFLDDGVVREPWIYPRSLDKKETTQDWPLTGVAL